MKDNSEIVWHNFIKHGDESSFAALYDYYADKLYSYGLHLGFNAETCKDAIQDVFIKIHSVSAKLPEIKNPTAFLFKSFKNRLIDIVRLSKRDVELNGTEDSFILNITVLDHIIDKERSERLKQKVELILNQLSATQREAVYMRYISGMEYKEISEILNIKPDSARKLMHRAMEKLREQNIDDFTKTALIITILFSK